MPNSVHLFHPVCDAHLRRRPGTCRRIVSTPGARCPVHNGGELSEEGRAVIAASARVRHAKQARAIARGEMARFPQGRKRKRTIPRPWRFALSEADEAAVLADMVRRDASAGIARPPWPPVRSCASVAADLERFVTSGVNLS
jgi:hypothetical protein